MLGYNAKGAAVIEFRENIRVQVGEQSVLGHYVCWGLVSDSIVYLFCPVAFCGSALLLGIIYPLLPTSLSLGAGLKLM